MVCGAGLVLCGQRYINYAKKLLKYEIKSEMLLIDLFMKKYDFINIPQGVGAQFHFRWLRRQDEILGINKRCLNV